MRFFYAIVHKDKGSAFGIAFPGMSGCFSAADRADDIFPNAGAALDLWLADADDASPISLEKVREMSAEDLADGAFMIAIPLV